MKILAQGGKYGTSWWGNVRPMLIVAFAIFLPAVLALPLIGLGAGIPLDEFPPTAEIGTWALMASLIPIGFALFMGSYTYMRGIVIDRHLRKSRRK